MDKLEGMTRRSFLTVVPPGLAGLLAGCRSKRREPRCLTSYQPKGKVREVEVRCSRGGNYLVEETPFQPQPLKVKQIVDAGSLTNVSSTSSKTHYQEISSLAADSHLDTIAFSYHRVSRSRGGETHQIMVYSNYLHELIKLELSGAPVKEMTLSESGNFLAYSTGKAWFPHSDKPTLHWVDLAKGTKVLIEGRASHLSLSQDGRKLAYQTEDKNRKMIKIADFSKGETSVIGGNWCQMETLAPVLSKDGQKVAFLGDSHDPYAISQEVNHGIGCLRGPFVLDLKDNYMENYYRAALPVSSGKITAPLFISGWDLFKPKSGQGEAVVYLNQRESESDPELWFQDANRSHNRKRLAQVPEPRKKGGALFYAGRKSSKEMVAYFERERSGKHRLCLQEVGRDNRSSFRGQQDQSKRIFSPRIAQNQLIYFSSKHDQVLMVEDQGSVQNDKRERLVVKPIKQFYREFF